ncbi:hypothetical protein GCM10007173_23620 [Glutamicibacter ardleyensis]|uniref:Uncharacterized protein n=1 Tax=Glutamicibacter ardleyensis TaxID=225894 RepID=A0ABQ2DM94_9MICC|nr:hypothetical protein GCM10007173_23620 [Glutamicibacter ardleyensis]
MQHHADPRTKVGVVAKGILAEQFNRSTLGSQKALSAGERGGLAGTIRAQKGCDLAGEGFEGDGIQDPEHAIIQRRNRSQILAQLTNNEAGSN